MKTPGFKTQWAKNSILFTWTWWKNGEHFLPLLWIAKTLFIRRYVFRRTHVHTHTIPCALWREGIRQRQGGDKSRQWEIWLVTCHWPCRLHHDDPLHLLFVCVTRLHRQDRQMTVCLWNANTQRARERDSHVTAFQLALNPFFPLFSKYKKHCYFSIFKSSLVLGFHKQWAHNMLQPTGSEKLKAPVQFFSFCFFSIKKANVPEFVQPRKEIFSATANWFACLVCRCSLYWMPSPEQR